MWREIFSKSPPILTLLHPVGSLTYHSERLATTTTLESYNVINVERATVKTSFITGIENGYKVHLGIFLSLI